MGRRRSAGTGHVYEKWGSYYGRWRTMDGRLLNRKVGKVRSVGERDGLTRTQAEPRTCSKRGECDRELAPGACSRHTSVTSLCVIVPARVVWDHGGRAAGFAGSRDRGRGRRGCLMV